MKMSNVKTETIELEFFQKNSAAFISNHHGEQRNYFARNPVAAKRSHVQPILYKRINAAASLDVSPATFDSWVLRGILPPGRAVGGLRMWSVRELESAAEELIFNSNNHDKNIEKEIDLVGAFQDFEG